MGAFWEYVGKNVRRPSRHFFSKQYEITKGPHVWETLSKPITEPH